MNVISNLVQQSLKITLKSERSGFQSIGWEFILVKSNMLSNLVENSMLVITS